MTDQLKRAISAAKTAQSNSDYTDAVGIASSSAGDQHFDMSESSYKTSHTAIRKARRFAMQGLYEWLMTDRRFDTTGKLGWKDNAPHDIAARTRATNAMHTVHIGYYHEMMRDIPEQIQALDTLISEHLDREIDKLDTVEHAILLVGAYELQNRLEIPYKVVLDEAMKLNNHFGATDAHKLINAVLDRMAIELRDTEVQADIKANLRTSQKPTIKQATIAAQVDTPENTSADNDSDSKPTTSTKPRISASNTNIKRNRSNKANTAISDFKAKTESNAKMAAANVETVLADNVEAIDVETIDTSVENISTNDVAINNDVAIHSEALNEQATDNHDIDSIVDEHIINDSVSTDNSLSTATDTTADDVTSIATDGTEIDGIETNMIETDSAAQDSADAKNTDAKSND